MGISLISCFVFWFLFNVLGFCASIHQAICPGMTDMFSVDHSWGSYRASIVRFQCLLQYLLQSTILGKKMSLSFRISCSALLPRSAEGHTELRFDGAAEELERPPWGRDGILWRCQIHQAGGAAKYVHPFARRSLQLKKTVF